MPKTTTKHYMHTGCFSTKSDRSKLAYTNWRYSLVFTYKEHDGRTTILPIVVNPVNSALTAIPTSTVPQTTLFRRSSDSYGWYTKK